jgi:hypothetical protein
MPVPSRNSGRVCSQVVQGPIISESHDAQQFRASGLNLVIAAIVYWNSTYLADAVDHLLRGGQPVSSELLAHTSPLTWEHIGFSGQLPLGPRRRFSRAAPAPQPQLGTEGGLMTQPMFSKRSSLALFSQQPTLCPHLDRRSISFCTRR